MIRLRHPSDTCLLPLMTGFPGGIFQQASTWTRLYTERMSQICLLNITKPAIYSHFSLIELFEII